MAQWRGGLRSSLRPPVRRTALVVIAVAAGLLVTGVGVAVAGRDPVVTVRSLMVAGTPEPGEGPVELDASLYLPAARPAPAVLLATGFGGTKADLDPDARFLAEHGYVVLTYTARGFGRSGGLVHLDSPDYEVADGRRLLDLLATRAEVVKDGPGDPRVGVAGGSYGGALSLLLAGTDHRVDAVVPSITWNDLRQALFPQFEVTGTAQPGPASVTPVDGPGVFKRMWAAVFFGDAFGGSAGAHPTGGTAEAGQTPACGRFAFDVCTAYARLATGTAPSAADLDLLARSSPARVLGRITAPTLLIQGEADSLFPLSEGEANATGIAAHGTPVKVVWTAGGHDGGLDETDRLRRLTLAWFGRYLRHDGTPADTRFEVTVPDALVSSVDSNPAPQVRVAGAYPGASAAGSGAAAAALQVARLPLSGAEQPVIAPPGGLPAAVSTLPGLGQALGLAAGVGGLGGGPGADGGSGAAGGGTAALGALPGQTASFDTVPLRGALTVIGGGRVTVHVTSTAPDATLFASLLDVAPDGGTVRPEQLVTPVRLTGLPAAGRDVTIALPAVVHDVAAGHRLRVTLSTTDQGYALPNEPRLYVVGLGGDHSLGVPQVPMTALVGPATRTLALVALGMLGVLLAGAVFFALRGRRRRGRSPAEGLAGVPLVLVGLGKVYGGGIRAVDELSLTVEPGQVLGLLGPNGAGKTTVLRMVMGLIRPTEGEIRVFGHAVVPGAPVLSRVGSFVEGPGFLPHLSGLENLRLYWRATGRPPGDARIEEALEVAGLDEDVHRRIRGYSHGMKQRLAIAQAMLGLPDLLVLDEPTNGLDPPQIREMREVLARYAAGGRTVVVSSHLLAEVEQTCTHVVVMNRGRLVAQGPVTQIAGAATVVTVDVDDPSSAARIASGVAGVHDVEPTATGLIVRVSRTARGDLMRALVNGGLQVERMAPQRGLEEAFLTLVGEDIGSGEG